MSKVYKLPRVNIFSKVSQNIKIEELIPPILIKIKKYLLIKKFENDYYDYLHPIIASHSWEQEDLILWDIFDGKKQGNYLDIGCNDPILGNNTYKFYKEGWTGVNIDLEEFKIQECKKIRPLDLNLQIIISGNNKKIKKRMSGNDSSLSGVIEGLDASYSSKTIYELYTTYLKNSFKIDILSIDTEGTELEILSCNNWTEFRPTTILIEVNADWDILQKFFIDNNYLPIYRNRINAIFIDEFTQDENLKLKFIKS